MRKYYMIVFIVFIVLIGASSIFAASEWSGVDETVVEKIASEHGRQAKEPLINTDQGDLLLFVFLVSGAVGGFIAGYNWRRLMEKN
jgi:ABC-type cobalt transport system substrate-binding protein